MGAENEKEPGCHGRWFSGRLACFALAVSAVAAVLASMPLWVGPAAKDVSETAATEIGDAAVHAAEAYSCTGSVQVAEARVKASGKTGDANFSAAETSGAKKACGVDGEGKKALKILFR